MFKVIVDKLQQIGQLGSYLFQELPWHLWRPVQVLFYLVSCKCKFSNLQYFKSELKQIYDWLHHPPMSVENHLARYV